MAPALVPIAFGTARRRARPLRCAQPCSTSAAWLPPTRAAESGFCLRRGGFGAADGYAFQPAGLQFQLHHEYDSDVDEEPEKDPPSLMQPTAPPLQRALIQAHDKLRRMSVASRRLLAGGVSAGVSKTATAPLETVKMQLVQGRMTALAAAQRIMAEHGPLGFFRGNAVDVARTVPSKAVELAAYETFKKGLRRWRREDGRHVLPDALVAGLAGGMAGIVSTIITYPMETVRTRMAVAGQGAAYSSVLDCVAKMNAQEGPASLWRGLDVSLAGVIPYAALRLGCYDALKWSWKKATGKHHIDPQAALLFGAIAGVASSTATYPLEVARRRMMMGAAYPSVAGALGNIAQQEGVAALFSGVWLGVVKQAPQYAIGFAAYEQAKQWLDL